MALKISLPILTFLIAFLGGLSNSFTDWSWYESLEQSSLRPPNYIFGIVLGLLALFSSITLESALNTLEFSMITTMLAMFVISRLMIPAINKARDMGEVAKKKFNQLHLVSVLLNFLALIVGLVLIYLII